MKKLMMIVIILTLIFTSCGNVAEESTAQTTEETTTAETTTATSTTTISTLEETTTVETTTAEMPSMTTETTIETEPTMEETYETLPDMFEYLMEFPGDRGFFYGKADIRETAMLDTTCVGMRFRVVGYEPSHNGLYGTIYYVKILETYGEEKFDICEIDYNATYEMLVRGKLHSHLYGRPPLEIGEDYFRYIDWQDFNYGYFGMGLVMDIEEVDGKQYLYGYGIDMSVWDCAEEITDAEENQIYKVGRDDKVIAYLNSIGKELPTFDYRCELFEWMDEVGIYTKE